MVERLKRMPKLKKLTLGLSCCSLGEYPEVMKILGVGIADIPNLNYLDLGL